MKHFFFSFLCLLALQVLAQNESQKWYFGSNAGLDFSTNPPTPLTNGMLNTIEGCATICDASGNLLFYTDGSTVYDQTHAVMANGTGLSGNSSSTQSAIIVKKPGGGSIYYIFTQWVSNGVKVSTVDMSLAAGLGSVTVLNATVVAPSTTEKLTAVRHCNGTDMWVVTHLLNSNVFVSIPVTAAGIGTNVVNSAIGSSHSGAIGHLKASPNGSKLAVGIYNENTFELFDFDNTTGVVSNSLSLGSFQNPYGLEFSPDGSKLYGVLETLQPFPLYQWNLCAGSPTAIVASQTVIANDPTAVEHGALQLAQDGKIYLCRYNSSTLAVIHDPNQLGAACNFSVLGLSIAPKVCRLGFPNFVSSFFRALTPFTYTVANCQTAYFTAPPVATGTVVGCSASGSTLSGISWNFGDPASGAQNTSTLTTPQHNYPGAGSYTVNLILYYNCSNDTIKQVVNVPNGAPTLTVGGRMSICAKESTTLTAGGANTYSWTRPNYAGYGSTVVVSPTVSSTYTLTGTNTVTGCYSIKVVSVTVNKCLSISETNQSPAPMVYPNPSSGEFVLESNTTLKLMIYDPLGKLIYEANTLKDKQVLDLSAYSDGLYLLKTIGTGGESHMIRLIKRTP